MTGISLCESWGDILHWFKHPTGGKSATSSFKLFELLITLIVKKLNLISNANFADFFYSLLWNQTQSTNKVSEFFKAQIIFFKLLSEFLKNKHCNNSHSLH